MKFGETKANHGGTKYDPHHQPTANVLRA